MTQQCRAGDKVQPRNHRGSEGGGASLGILSGGQTDGHVGEIDDCGCAEQVDDGPGHDFGRVGDQELDSKS